MEHLRTFPDTRKQSLGILLPALLGVVLVGAGMAWAAYGQPSGSPALDVSASTVALKSFSGRFVPLLIVLAGLLGFLSIYLPSLLEVPHAKISQVCLFIVSAGALVVACVGSMEDMSVVAALSVPLVFVAEMFRPGSRENLLRQVSGTYTGALIVMMGALWMFVVRMDEGGYLGLLCAAALAGALIVTMPLLGQARLIGAPVGALAGALLAQLFLPDTDWWLCLVLAVSLGLVLWGLDGLARMVGMRGGKGPWACFGLIPVSAMGVVGYALALIVL